MESLELSRNIYGGSYAQKVFFSLLSAIWELVVPFVEADEDKL